MTFIIENNSILKKFNIEFLVIFNIIICKESLTEENLRKSMIYIEQYKETLFLGFLFLFLFEYISYYFFLIDEKNKEVIKNIRFVLEVEENKNNKIYLLKRKKFNWLKY